MSNGTDLSSHPVLRYIVLASSTGWRGYVHSLRVALAHQWAHHPIYFVLGALGVLICLILGCVRLSVMVSEWLHERNKRRDRQRHREWSFRVLLEAPNSLSDQDFDDLFDHPPDARRQTQNILQAELQRRLHEEARIAVARRENTLTRLRQFPNSLAPDDLEGLHPHNSQIYLKHGSLTHEPLSAEDLALVAAEERKRLPSGLRHLCGQALQMIREIPMLTTSERVIVDNEIARRRVERERELWPPTSTSPTSDGKRVESYEERIRRETVEANSHPGVFPGHGSY